jgi:hypothetical protein
MGPLYSTGLVHPLYLADYYGSPAGAQRGPHTVEAARDDDDVKKPKEERTLAALRRGWIQQEVSYGQLDSAVVSKFVAACVAQGEFGMLGTLLRRRASAMWWLLRQNNDNNNGSRRDAAQPNFVDLQDREFSCRPHAVGGVAHALRDEVGVISFGGSPQNGVSSEVTKAVARMIKKAFFAANPDAVSLPPPPEASVEWSTLSSEEQEDKRRDYTRAVADTKTEFFHANLEFVSDKLGQWGEDFVEQLCATRECHALFICFFLCTCLCALC